MCYAWDNIDIFHLSSCSLLIEMKIVIVETSNGTIRLLTNGWASLRWPTLATGSGSEPWIIASMLWVDPVVNSCIHRWRSIRWRLKTKAGRKSLQCMWPALVLLFARTLDSSTPLEVSMVIDVWAKWNLTILIRIRGDEKSLFLSVVPVRQRLHSLNVYTSWAAMHLIVSRGPCNSIRSNDTILSPNNGRLFVHWTAVDRLWAVSHWINESSPWVIILHRLFIFNRILFSRWLWWTTLFFCGRSLRSRKGWMGLRHSVNTRTKWPRQCIDSRADAWRWRLSLRRRRMLSREVFF